MSDAKRKTVMIYMAKTSSNPDDFKLPIDPYTDVDLYCRTTTKFQPLNYIVGPRDSFYKPEGTIWKLFKMLEQAPRDGGEWIFLTTKKSTWEDSNGQLYQINGARDGKHRREAMCPDCHVGDVHEIEPYEQPYYKKRKASTTPVYQQKAWFDATELWNKMPPDQTCPQYLAIAQLLTFMETKEQALDVMHKFFPQ